ncbi:RagB/SusD family nutrient uptake outer membrane protein [Pinibacter soli]|uniref:RagB/SusD family nutrient uptake outer membrane protein n=1 Tax=Pinibacter soli TaxID=3044211 RepID=A0ABT6RH71_9BACT|nr:RagB/SusD family nutrient uptake outer membrane protein [Pinibacter soli]MDI3321182.1 RagB/SusD family nutrient uptake outer membrane protein [Pinibacter soli]
MTKKIFYLLLFGAAISMIACNKKLDISPENTLVDKDVFATSSGAEQALMEGYYNLFGSATQYIAYTFGDFSTTTLNHAINYDAYVKGTALPTDYSVVGMWTEYFQTVNIANNIIDKIPRFGQFEQAKEDQFIAEAKFIRAYAYLDLLKLYGDGALTGKMDGLGLPLQLTPFQGYKTGQVIPRSTNGDIYNSIVKDLTEAAAILPEKQANDLNTRSRATKGGANALLARCYLYMGKFKEAGDAAKAVLDETGTYSIVNNLLQLFPANPSGAAQNLTAEHILAFPVSQMVGTSTSVSNSVGSTYYYKRAFWINKNFMSEFESGDLRVSQLMFKGDQIYNTDRLNDYTTFKFNNQNSRDNVPVIRLAEVMLVRSEALARIQGVNAESITLLNTIRTRSLPNATPLTSADFANANALIEKILQQRKFELAFEGFYRYDLIRTGKPLQSPDLPEAKKVLPIPQSEIDISNGLIKQNTGYAP